jgi:integrase
MAVFKRGDRWAVTVHEPNANTKSKKRWVGTFATFREAKDAEGDARKQVRRQSGRVAADEFARTWIDRYPRRRESTNIGHRERVSKFETDFAGQPLDSITRIEARAWALANRSRVESVRAMFSDAARDGLVAENPFSNLRLRESDGRKHLVVPTDAELGELAIAAAKIQGEWGRLVLAPFVIFAAHTGLRPGELYALCWDDVNLTGNTVAVEWQWSQTERRVVRPKYESTRTVVLPPAAKDALDQVARVRAEVFSAPRGGRLSGTVMGHYWPPVARSVGRPDFTPHCLRHYYGTLLARKGVLPYDIAAMTGHKDGGKLAMDRYIHVTERDAREKVAAAFGSNVRELRPVSEAGSEA